MNVKKSLIERIRGRNKIKGYHASAGFRSIIFMMICMVFISACGDHTSGQKEETERYVDHTFGQKEEMGRYGDHTSGQKEDNGRYGVFIGTDEDLDQFESFHTVVIDAQYFDADEILSFKNRGHKVYSYINIGSLEKFRNYYDEYKDLAIGKYENWDDEVWIDVSVKRWQDFVQLDLAPSLVSKGIDGFFVDNCDVYYQYPTDEILDGTAHIMLGLKDFGLEVIINGGDAFLDAYCDGYGSWNDIITGINQENVFSSICWNDGSFGRASDEDKEYFCGYLDRYADLGADIYILEYTNDDELIREIDAYCRDKGYQYYISKSIDLISDSEIEQVDDDQKQTVIEDQPDQAMSDISEPLTVDSFADEGTDTTGKEYGRILFVGDSRTIDMFADSDDELSAFEAGDDILVYARHGFGFHYLTEVVEMAGIDNFDTLVTWMGANDGGDFSSYRGYYESLLEKGVTIVVCTIGPTYDDRLAEYDRPYYDNVNMISFNESLVSWAKDRNVRIIDLYKYISDSDSIKIDEADGIHYLPRPTTELWDYIRSELNDEH
jgi:hypothetical protein